jgi:Relaxase/Mobilisation nuclease domain
VIVKKVASKGGGGGKAKSLSDYIRDEKEKEEIERAKLEEIKDEKVTHTGALNFISDNPKVQAREMTALAQDAPRSKDPIAHYVMSWKENEQPTTQQIDQAVEIFLDEMELTGHQTIYALHEDTSNVHLHLIVNRVHPDTLKVIRPNKGFDIKAAHRAIAKIEHVQGWQREAKGCYRVAEDGKIERSHKSEKKQPGQKARDFEQRTGEKSAQRIAIERAAQIIREVQQWQQLHEELAAEGMKYEKKGSGAIITVGDTVIKASSADRSAALGKVEKRLGRYQPAAVDLVIAVKSPEPLLDNMPDDWQKYIQERYSQREERMEVSQGLRQRHRDERGQLDQVQAAREIEMLSGRWDNREELRDALKLAIGDEYSSEHDQLRQQQEADRRKMYGQYPHPLSLEDWWRSKGEDGKAEWWRYRETVVDPPKREAAGEEVSNSYEQKRSSGPSL